MQSVALLCFWAFVSHPAPQAAGGQSPAYLDPAQPLETRVEDLLSRMTLEEKVSLLHADSKFSTNAIPRLSIPKRRMSDGPHGVREDIGPDTWDPAGHTNDFSTFLPVNMCLASTWDPAMAERYGAVIGQEARARGKDIMLGPGVNIMRTPLNGRSFEYFGEDPVLTGKMAAGAVRGAQAQGISSCVKHFAGNDQEMWRGSVDVEMDDRAMREIYLAPFRTVVKEGGVWSVMGAYNKFRGVYCCENPLLLDQILKREWGFRGLVMTDWGGAHSTEGSVHGGLDLEMGSRGPYNGYYLADPYLAGLKSGKFAVAELDDKVRRNLRVMVATHAFDVRPEGSLNTKEHHETARQVAQEGIVLLKNEGQVLPLDRKAIRSVAVIGEDAAVRMAHGGGSAGIKALYEVTPLEALTDRFADNASVTYCQGYRAVAPGRFERGRFVPNPPEDKSVVEARIAQAVEAARRNDAVVLVAGLNHNFGQDAEGGDRKDLALPYGQDELIRQVARANRNTVVVLVSGGPVEMPWLGDVRGVVQAWYGGMEGGNALADVLLGDVNPSGKTPCTFPAKLEDSPAHALGAYPGKAMVEHYDEGLFVGYRWFDAKQKEPLFPFGFGLSYTTFRYGAPRVTRDASGFHLTCDVINTGSRAGKEVVQLYIRPGKARLERPIRELKAFAKVSLNPGETKPVTLDAAIRDFAYFDPAKQAWLAEKGTYQLDLASSSRDIRATLPATLDADETLSDR